jgi:hypothetical protein
MAAVAALTAVFSVEAAVLASLQAATSAKGCMLAASRGYPPGKFMEERNAAGGRTQSYFENEGQTFGALYLAAVSLVQLNRLSHGQIFVATDVAPLLPSHPYPDRGGSTRPWCWPHRFPLEGGVEYLVINGTTAESLTLTTDAS